jgi:hypothetical protein
MLGRIRAGLSFANVVSVIALFVALSGAAYATSGLVTGKGIENRSITGKDIQDGSILGKQIKEASLAKVERCPGSTPIWWGDICVGPVQTANTWANALESCRAVALRLPSVSEATLIASAAQLKSYIWTDDTVDLGPPVQAAVVRSINPNSVSTKDTTTLQQFRCVRSPGTTR